MLSPKHLLAICWLSISWAGAAALGEWSFEGDGLVGKSTGQPAQGAGISGKALCLDGKSSLEASAETLGGVPFSLEAWVKLDTLDQQWAGIMSRWSPGYKEGTALYYRGPGNGFRFEVKWAPDKVILIQTEKESLEVNTWYHLVATYDGAALVLYLNGNPLKKSGAVTLPEIAGPVYFGKMGPWNTDGFKGCIDEARLMPVALTAEEVLLRTRAHLQGSRVGVVVADFEDVGTWRAILNEGSKGRWFAGHQFLCSTQIEKCKGEWVGSLRYDFTEPSGPYRLAFRRAKIMDQRVAAPRGLSFFANPKDRDLRFSFELIDTKGKKASTPELRLEKNTWKEYQVSFGGLPALSALTGAVSVHTVNLAADKAGAGEMFLDDLTLLGETTDNRQMVSVTPVFRGLGVRPGEPVALSYRLRNQMEKAAQLAVKLEYMDFLGKPLGQFKKEVAVGAASDSVISFDLPPQEVGHYRVILSLSGSANYTADDMFAVYAPNGKRINKSPMWFGCEDQEMWEGVEENRLHKTWLGELGVDIVRFGITGGRFEHERGNLTGSTGFTPMLEELGKYGIDAFVIYMNAPDWTGASWGGSPKDMEAFGAHARNLGAYLAKFPQVKYMEFWNEPDVEAFKGTIEEYLEMMKTMATNLKATNPKIRLTTGGVTVRHPREKPGFTKGMYQMGKGLYDVAAFHSHGRLENYIENQGLVEGFLKGVDSTVPICNTESGERSAYDYSGYRGQASTLVKKISYAKSRGNTEFYSWFTLQDYWDMDPGADDSFGLVTSDNRAKPSFVAYNELIRQLANTKAQGEAGLDERLAGFRFQQETGGLVYVLWPKAANGNVLFSLETAQPVIRVDMFGKGETLKPEGGKVFVTVNGYPIYLKTSAPVSVAKGDRSFFTAPQTVAGSPGEKVDFSVTLKSPWVKKASVELVFYSELGKPLSTQNFPLEPGASKTISYGVLLPTGENLGQKQFYFTLSAPEVGLVNLFLPQSVVTAYKVTRLGGSFEPGGDAAVFGKAPALVLNTPAAVRDVAFDAATALWKGPEDLSVRGAIAHDGKNLLCRFDVADDNHVQGFGPGEMWKGDSLQIAFSSPDGKLSELCLGLGPQGPVAFCHTALSPALAGKWDVPLAIRREGGHTVYEVSLPFEKLGLSTANPTFRFSFLVNENDGKGRVRWMEWFAGIGGNKNAELFGFGRLE